jgi:hypothetical protein
MQLLTLVPVVDYCCPNREQVCSVDSLQIVRWFGESSVDYIGVSKSVRRLHAYQRYLASNAIRWKIL